MALQAPLTHRGLATCNDQATNQGGRGTQALAPPPLGSKEEAVTRLEEEGLHVFLEAALLLISYRGLVSSNHSATNQGGRGTLALVPPPQVTEAPPDFSKK